MQVILSTQESNALVLVPYDIYMALEATNKSPLIGKKLTGYAQTAEDFILPAYLYTKFYVYNNLFTLLIHLQNTYPKIRLEAL